MNKTIISLGTNCPVRIQHDKYYIKKETHFFDYLITGNTWTAILQEYIKKLSILNVNSIMCRCKPFEKNEFTILNQKDMEYFKQVVTEPVKHGILIHKDFVSIHDLNLNHNNFDECIDKFNRRLLKLINLIKSNNYIEFVRIECFDYDIEHYKIFISTIKKINKFCKFTIKLISYKNLFNNINIPEIKFYNINNFTIKNVKCTLDMSQIDWKKIFED